MLNELSPQKRLMIAMILAFVFFVAYDKFYISKLRQAQEANATTTMVSAKEAPKTQNSTIAPVNTASLNPTLVKVVSKDANFTIDTFGRINSYVLNDPKFKNEDGTQINLISNQAASLPLEMRFEDANLNNLAFSTPYSASTNNINVANGDTSVTLTQNLGDVVVTKILKFNTNGSYELDVKLSKNAPYFITPGSRPDVMADNYAVHGVLLRKNDESLEIFEDGDVKKTEQISDINLMAASDRYYTTLFYAPNLQATLADSDGVSQVFLRSENEIKVGGYIGPKDYKQLASIDSRLTDVIEYGWFTFLARPMFKFLSFLHDYIGNWGWAIVILTLIIRFILFPLSYKGMLSMNKLKDLAPKMKELQEKYKSDPQKLQAHMMELYRKNNANPMGGCLPILLQIPVFFAIYRVLLNAIELKGAPWILWIHDLAEKDPFYILPIAMGALMFLQQKITPTTFTDPMQEKVMKMLPLIFTVFFVMFPAGLTLYWTVNNICSIVQQYVINKMFEKHKRVEAEKHHEN